MNILIMEVTLRAIWAHSLKEKRMVVKSIVQKLKNKFNISVAEVESQDIHQIIVIGIAGICANFITIRFYNGAYYNFYRM